MQIKNMTNQEVRQEAFFAMHDKQFMVYDKVAGEELFEQFLDQYDNNQQFEVEMNDEQDSQEFININRVVK